jgi:hypothetical protein
MKIGARWGGIAAAGVALVALGACGNPVTHLTTERAAGDAFGQALAQPGLNLQISLGVTPNQLLQMNSDDHGSRRFTAQDASALAHTALVINVYPGHGESTDSKQFARDPNNQLELAVRVRGAQPVDVRDLGSTLYARADLPTLLADLGQPRGAAARVQQALRQADQYLPGLAALGQGRWVSADSQELAPLLKLGGLATANNSPNPAGAAALMQDLQSALDNNSSSVNLGKQGGRTEYRITLQARTILRQLSGDLSSLAGNTSIPGASSFSSLMTQGLAKSPKTVTVQLWVKDNKVQELDLDVNQFAHRYPFPVPVRVLIGPGSRVKAPASATPLQISGIAGLLGGLDGLGGSSRSGPGEAN